MGRRPGQEAEREGGTATADHEEAGPAKSSGPPCAGRATHTTGHHPRPGPRERRSAEPCGTHPGRLWPAAPGFRALTDALAPICSVSTMSRRVGL